MTTAFVLSGGGSLGAVQVGMLEALAAEGIEADLLVGTSVGAINAAYLAGAGTGPVAIAGLRSIWNGLSRADVFPLEPRRLLAAALGRVPALCSNTALRSLLERQVAFERVEDAAIPLRIVTTDVRSGLEVVISTGNLVDAVLASAAIPAVFPSIRIDGKDLIDGGVSNNAAVSHAAAWGADTIYVLPTGYACALDDAPSTPLSSAMHSLTLLIQQRLITDVDRLATDHDIRVLPPLCPLSVSPVDFGQISTLIDRARHATGEWLRQGGAGRPHPERILSLHSHPSRVHHFDRADDSRHP